MILNLCSWVTLLIYLLFTDKKKKDDLQGFSLMQLSRKKEKQGRVCDTTNARKEI